MLEVIGVSVTWIVAMLFWVFLVWALFTTVATLREIRDDLRAVRSKLDA